MVILLDCLSSLVAVAVAEEVVTVMIQPLMEEQVEVQMVEVARKVFIHPVLEELRLVLEWQINMVGILVHSDNEVLLLVQMLLAPVAVAFMVEAVPTITQVVVEALATLVVYPVVLCKMVLDPEMVMPELH